MTCQKNVCVGGYPDPGLKQLEEYANDNIHLPINLLGLIVNRLQFSYDNVFSIECIP